MRPSGQPASFSRFSRRATEWRPALLNLRPAAHGWAACLSTAKPLGGFRGLAVREGGTSGRCVCSRFRLLALVKPTPEGLALLFARFTGEEVDVEAFRVLLVAAPLDPLAA